MTFNTWTTEKPDFDQECLLITAVFLRRKWYYDTYMVEWSDDVYWMISTMDGQEWGDIADLSADKYYVMELSLPQQEGKTDISEVSYDAICDRDNRLDASYDKLKAENESLKSDCANIEILRAQVKFDREQMDKMEGDLNMRAIALNKGE